MKFIKMVSFFCIMTVAVSSVSYGVPITPQIRNLLEEKEEKIKALEQCDGKRKGWMIAGISTIGLTAVGVGVNIAQANKSSKLSDQIDTAKQELSRHETHLAQIQSQIAEKSNSETETVAGVRDNMIQPFDGVVIWGDREDESSLTFVSIKCGKGNVDYSPREFPDWQNQNTDIDGKFYFDKPVPRDAKCTLSLSGWNPLEGSIEDLYNHRAKVIMCNSSSNVHKSYPIGLTTCDSDSANSSGKTSSNSKQYNLDPRIDGIGNCYYTIDGTDKDQSGCSVSNSGDWGVKFPDYTVMGIAACSDLPGEYSELATDQAKVDAAYTRTSTSLPKGGNCYCKMESPVMSSWVFQYSFDGYCAWGCAFDCAYLVEGNADFRGAVFGSVGK
jgi:hypothetical protein